MTTDAFKELGFAIIIQAVDDVRELRRAGIIVNNRCVAKWPKIRNNRGGSEHKLVLGYYRSRRDVQELLNFFLGNDLAKLLAVLNSDVDSAVVANGVGLSVANTGLHRTEPAAGSGTVRGVVRPFEVPK